MLNCLFDTSFCFLSELIIYCLYFSVLINWNNKHFLITFRVLENTSVSKRGKHAWPYRNSASSFSIRTPLHMAQQIRVYQIYFLLNASVPRAFCPAAIWPGGFLYLPFIVLRLPISRPFLFSWVGSPIAWILVFLFVALSPHPGESPLLVVSSERGYKVRTFFKFLECWKILFSKIKV